MVALITWGSDFATTTLGVMSDVASNFTTPIMFILGVLSVAIILKVVIGSIIHH